MKSVKTWYQALIGKLGSRKFLMAMGGVVSGIILLRSGSTAEGAALLGASILGYLIAEGYVDAQGAALAAETVADVAGQAGIGGMKTAAVAMETAAQAAQGKTVGTVSQIDTERLAGIIAEALQTAGVIK